MPQYEICLCRNKDRNEYISEKRGKPNLWVCNKPKVTLWMQEISILPGHLRSPLVPICMPTLCWKHVTKLNQYVVNQKLNHLYYIDFRQRSSRLKYNHRVNSNNKDYIHCILRVECTVFCNLQSRARTHAVLVIGLNELLFNRTT
jgi:hypothetical protein